MAQVKFMRVATRPTFVAANHDGVILFETSTQNLYMGKEGWVLYSKVKDVRFNENKLEVTYDGDTWSTLLDLTSGSYTVPASKVTVADAGDKLTANNVEDALAELKDAINDVDSAAKSYTIVEDAAANYSSTNVLKRYRLQETIDGNSSFVGAPIEIMKDRSLADVTFSNQQLHFTYNLADGTQSTVDVDVSAFLTEEEYADGLSVANHIISVNAGDGLEFKGTGDHKPVGVKIDSTSESFLTVGANGVKLAGVQDAIDNVKVSASTTTPDYLDVTADTAGRAITVDAKQQDVETSSASAKGLAEASDVKAYVDKKSAAASTVVQKDTNANHLTVSSTTNAAGATVYTIGENDIASDSDLTAEVTRAKAAEGEIADKIGLAGAEGSRVWTPTTNYGGTTTNAQANMQAIDAAVKANADAIDELEAKNVSIVEKNTDATADTNDKYIKVTKVTDGSTGSDTYTVTTTGIDAALNGKKNVQTAVDKTVADAAKIVTGVHQNTNGDITSIDEANVGTRLLTGYTLGNSVGVAATDTVNQALGKLQYELTWIEA